MNLQIHKNNILHIINQFENITFLNATNILIDKNNIQNTQYFIQSLQNMISYDKEIISPKVLLSSFLIYFFHEDVLSENKTDSDTFIFEKSKTIVKLTKQFSYKNKIDIFHYIAELNKYKFFFEKWKKKDLDSQLQIYKQMYFDSQFNPEIKNKIQKLIGKDKTNELLVITEDNIQQNLKKAFWNILTEEFENDNYSNVLSIMKDIKFYFLKINHKLELQLKEYLDDELVTIHIQNKNFFQLFEMLKFCLIELKKLDAPVYDNHNQTLQNLNEINTSNFIIILSFLLERLEFVSSLKI